MIKFEFESLEELQHVLEAVQTYQVSRNHPSRLKPETLAETFLWVYEKTGDE